VNSSPAAAVVGARLDPQGRQRRLHQAHRRRWPRRPGGRHLSRAGRRGGARRPGRRRARAWGWRVAARRRRAWFLPAEPEQGSGPPESPAEPGWG